MAGLSKSRVYLANLWVLTPRHWLVYLLVIVVFLMIFVNIDGGPGKDDSGHYFMLWFMGVLGFSTVVAVMTINLLCKPVLFCMPRQLSVSRNVIFGLGLLINAVFYVVAIMPEHSYWAPSDKLALAAILVTGQMLVLLSVTICMVKSSLYAWFTTPLMLLSPLVKNVYFHGLGPDIVRPPVEFYYMFGGFSLVVIAVCWTILGDRNTLRKLILIESTPGADTMTVARELENMSLFNRSRGMEVEDFGVTGAGEWLLEKIAGVSNNARAVWSMMYRIGSANHLGKAFLWTLCMITGGWFLAEHIHDEFEPEVLLCVVSILIAFQGELMFRRTTNPLLPMGRRALFAESLANSFTRFLLLLLVFLILAATASGVGRIWSSPAAGTLLELSSYPIFMVIMPLLIFAYHIARTPVSMSLQFTSSMALVYSSPILSAKFMAQSLPVMIGFMIAAWIPFLILARRRNFGQDLR